MDNISHISYKFNMSAEQLVRFHLLFYTHVNDIAVTKADMNALVLLGLRGKPDLLTFCKELVERGVYLSMQSARNAISKLCTDKELVVKDGNHKKQISLSADLNISVKKNTLLSINCLYN